MSNTIDLQIEKSRVLIEGLSKNIDPLAGKGISDSRLGGQHLWLSVLAVVVAARDATVVHPSWHTRFASAIGISRVDVYDNDSPHQYRDALSAALLPRLFTVRLPHPSSSFLYAAMANCRRGGKEIL